MKKIFKYIEYFQTKIIRKFKNRIYKFDDINLNYMFYKEKKSKNLVIVFSACTREGVKARYNYVRTLKNIKINKLFILDDFGCDKRGEYYLGEAPKYNVENAVKSLIDKYKNKYNRIYFIGSSKGGFAALNFGFKYDNSIIIIGAPQFYLGNYLSDTPNILTYRSMKLDEKEVNFLNKKIINEILNKKKNIKVYLHYSNQEHTYKDHVKDLIKELKKNNVFLEEDIANYKEHSDVSLYFPKYLKNVLISEEKND